jgi:PAS domain S-box-containing protein
MEKNAETIERGQLLQVLQATAPYTGDEFFHHLTRAITRATATRWGFVVELLLDADHVHIVSACDGDEDLGVWDHQISEAPASETLALGHSAYEDDLDLRFPAEPWIREHGAKAYVAVTLRAASGDPIGIFGVLHDTHVDSAPVVVLLEELSPRVSAELERRQVDHALRRSEARFRLLAECSKDILFYCQMRPTTQFEYISPAAEDITGYPPEAFRANAGLATQMLQDEDRQRVLNAIATGSEEAIVARLNRPDGGQRWIEYRNYPLRDTSGRLVAVGGTIRDATQRIEAQEGLKRSEQTKKALLEAIPDMLFRVRADGTFTDFLPGEVTRGVSVPLDGVVGMNIRDALPAFAGPLRRLMQRASSTGRLQRVEFEMAGNGEPRFYEARCIPFGDEEVLLILRDFTAVKWHEGEEERRRIRDELDNKVERLRTNPYGLTYRELTILHLVSEGSADKQIAEALGISTYTVNKHVANILGKMNAVSRTEAGVRAIREGMLAA